MESALINVQIEMRVLFPDLSVEDSIDTYRIGPSSWKIAAILPKRDKHTGFRVTIPFRSAESRENLNKAVIKRTLGPIPKGRSFNLEHLLLDQASHFRITLTAQHPVFGSTGFIQKEYHLDDIREGRFSKHDCNIVKYAGEGLELERHAASYYGKRSQAEPPL